MSESNSKNIKMGLLVFFTLIISCLLVICITGCSGNETNTDSSSQDSSAQTEGKEETIDEQVQSVIDAIDSIGEVTLDSKEQIENARKKYDVLNDDQKTQVSNYAILEKDESTLAELENANTAIAVGETVSDEDFSVTLTNAYISNTVENPDSRTYWEADSGMVFVVMEFDVTALNSNEIAVNQGAISDVVANYNGNTYKSFEYKYVVSELWLSAKNTYFDADMPVHIYVYRQIPESAINRGVTVDMVVAGQDKQLPL